MPLQAEPIDRKAGPDAKGNQLMRRRAGERACCGGMQFVGFTEFIEFVQSVDPVDRSVQFVPSR